MSTILVVDDAPAFRKPIVACLHMAGYHALEANNGREALEIARAERPDLILLDLAMPEMDGLEFLAARKGEAELMAIPIILITAVTEEHFVAQAQALGICDRLLKSQFSMREMKMRIERQLAATKPAGTCLPAPKNKRHLAVESPESVTSLPCPRHEHREGKEPNEHHSRRR